MSASGAWLREEQADLAVQKILAGASAAFLELGVSGAGMNDIARHAGCSRGTLYRYFKSRHELHLAYVNHSAVELSERVKAGLAAIADPRERLIEGIVRSVAEVRATPGTAVWFEPAESGMAARMSRCSEVVDALAAAFVEQLLASEGEDETAGLRARWMVRVILSLLTMPGGSEAEERELVERFVVPGMLQEDASGIGS